MADVFYQYFSQRPVERFSGCVILGLKINQCKVRKNYE